MRELCDMHCHIVPYVDDGAKNTEISIKLLKLEYDQGVRSVILTPHYRRGMFETSREDVLRQFVKLQQEAQTALPEMKLYLGCEFHANHEMVSRLNTSEYYRMGGSFYVLTEFAEHHEASYIRHRTNELIQAGYTPIIAHVERYPACARDISLIRFLKDEGCLIQVNADSVIGREGWGMKRFVKKMIKEDLVDYIGSDAHNLTDRAPHLQECAEYLERTFGQEYMEKVMHENILQLIQSMQESTDSTAEQIAEEKTAALRRKPVLVEEPEI